MMINKFKYKTIKIMIIVSIFVSTIMNGPTVLSNNLNLGYINISVEDAWGLLNDTTNGLQIPIDVRTDSEWLNERINTPFPEEPKYFCLSDIQTENGLQTFLSQYNRQVIILYCKSGGRSSTAASILENGGFNGTLYNMIGGITDWKSKGYPTKKGNTIPNKPGIPTGSIICNIGVPYIFSSEAIDPDDDSIRYGWDWNDDNVIENWTQYSPSGATIEISHRFSQIDVYNVKVIAEDNVGYQSEWSEILTVNINQEPNSPTINGPKSGRFLKEYTYEFYSDDIEGDNVSYYVDWGDGTYTEWTELYNSGEKINLKHSWNKQGDYIIKAKVKDEYDAESNWSNFSIAMPKNKQIAMYFMFSKLVEEIKMRYPLEFIFKLPIASILIKSCCL